MLELRKVGNWKYDSSADPNCLTSIPNFIEIRLVFLELKHADRQALPALHAFIMRIKQRMRKNDNDYL
jgi:hypothetical protein